MATILDEQNPWWRGAVVSPFPVRRAPFEELRRRLAANEPRSTVLIGPRGVGKSVLLHQLAISLVAERGGLAPERVVYVRFDDVRLAGLAGLDDVIGSLPALPGGTPRIWLFDEIQALPRWANSLKTHVDRGLGPFLATGSSARLVRDGIHEFGTRRFASFELGTWTYGEWKRLLPERASDAATQDSFTSDYLTFGGWPENALAVTDEAQLRIPERIRQDFESALQKDLPDVRQRHRLRQVVRMLAQDPGGIVSADRLVSRLQLQPNESVSGSTVNNWLHQLTDAGLFHLLQAAGRTERSVAGKRFKIYPCDTGVATAFAPLPFDPGQSGEGKLAEVSVLLHLRVCARGAGQLSFHHDPRGEIDFVVRTDSTAVGIEVKGARVFDRRDVERLVGRCARLGIGDCMLVSRAAEEIRETTTHQGRGVRIVAIPLHHFLERVSDQPLDVLDAIMSGDAA